MSKVHNHKLNLLLDVGFNREVAEDSAFYWGLGNGELAKLINKIERMSDNEIADMGRNAKKRVANEYTWEKICEQYKDIFFLK